MSGPANNSTRCPVCGLAPEVRGCEPGKCLGEAVLAAAVETARQQVADAFADTRLMAQKITVPPSLEGWARERLPGVPVEIDQTLGDGKFRILPQPYPEYIDAVIGFANPTADKPPRLWWLSFCDDGRPKGQQFLGVAIVWADDTMDAIRMAHLLDCNPGGQVAAAAWEGARYHPDPIQLVGRLLTKEEALEVNEAAKAGYDAERVRLS